MVMTMKNATLFAAVALAIGCVTTTGVDAQVDDQKAACAAATDCESCLAQPDCYHRGYDQNDKIMCDSGGYDGGMCLSVTINKDRFPGAADLPATAASMCAQLKVRELAATAKLDAGAICGAKITADTDKGCASCLAGEDVCMFWKYNDVPAGTCSVDNDKWMVSQRAAGLAQNGEMCEKNEDCAGDATCGWAPSGTEPPADMPKMCIDSIQQAVYNAQPPPPMAPPSGRRLLCSPMRPPDFTASTLATCPDEGGEGGSAPCEDLSCTQCVVRPECYIDSSTAKCVTAQPRSCEPTYVLDQQNSVRFPDATAEKAAELCLDIDAEVTRRTNFKAKQAECARLMYCDSCSAADGCDFFEWEGRANTCGYSAKQLMDDNVYAGVKGEAAHCARPTAMVAPPKLQVADGESCPSDADKDPVPYKDQTDTGDIDVGDGGGAAAVSTVLASVAGVVVAALLL